MKSLEIGQGNADVFLVHVGLEWAIFKDLVVLKSEQLVRNTKGIEVMK